MISVIQNTNSKQNLRIRDFAEQQLKIQNYLLKFKFIDINIKYSKKQFILDKS